MQHQYAIRRPAPTVGREDEKTGAQKGGPHCWANKPTKGQQGSSCLGKDSANMHSTPAHPTTFSIPYEYEQLWSTLHAWPLFPSINHQMQQVRQLPSNVVANSQV